MSRDHQSENDDQQSVADTEDLNFDGSDSEDGEDRADKTRWLVSGGKDTRVAIWSLMDFGSRNI